MQIREQGNKIQLIRTHYKADKKRTEGKVFDRFDKDMTTIPDSTRQLLTKEEVEQLENYLSKRIETEKLDRLKLYLSNPVYGIRQMIAALSVDEAKEGFTQKTADELYLAMSDLKKALKKAGFTQPKPTAEPKPTDTKTTDLFPKK